MVSILPFNMANLKSTRNFSSDVNIFIAHEDLNDSFYKKSCDLLFENINNYQTFLFFNRIKTVFIQTVSFWISTAADIVGTAVNSVINELREKNQPSIQDDIFITMVDDKINSLLKIYGRNSQKIENEISKIKTDFRLTDLVHEDVRKRMIEKNMNLANEESHRRLDSAIKLIRDKIQVCDVPPFSDEKVIKVLNKYTGFKDAEDRSISQEILSFHLETKIVFDFYSGDNDFIKFLKDICTKEQFSINPVLL